MAVDFLRHKYQDGLVYSEVKHLQKGFGLGLRHVEAIYMFACLGVFYMIRSSTEIGLLAITDISRRNDTSEHEVPIFEWNFRTQGTIVSSFFFGYTLMMVPVELCAKRFNAKYLIFLVLLINGGLYIVLPTVVNKGDWVAVSNAQLLMGMTQSCVVPATQELVSSWLPPQERTTLGAFIYSGVQIGTIISWPLATVLVTSMLKWHMLFYIWGIVMLSTATVWCTLTASAPGQHHAIGDKEKDYIQDAVSDHLTSSNVPWRVVVRSRPFWALVAAHVGYHTLYTLFLFAIPIYLTLFLKIPTQNVGWCMSLPFLSMWVATLLVCPAANSVYSNTVINDYLNISYYRKLLNTTGAFGVSVGLIILSALPPDQTCVALILTIVVYSSTAFQFSGFLENHADAAPQYSGSILFVTSFIANALGSFVPLLCGLILDLDVSSEARWRIIFVSAAVVGSVCNVLYVAFGSCDKHLWSGYNFKSISKDEKEIILEDMKSKTVYQADLRVPGARSN